MALKQTQIPGQFLAGLFSAESLFRNLSPNARQILSDITQTKQIQKDSLVIKPGDLTGIYVLVEGRAKMILFNRLNHQKIIQSVEPKEIIGVVETIADEPFRINVQTLTPCVFEFIKETNFICYLHNQPELCFQLLKLLGLNLNKSYQTFISTTF